MALLLITLSFINSQNMMILATSYTEHKDDSKVSPPYPPYHGDTLYVGKDGSDSYNREQAKNYNTPWLTIQKAVDNSEAGDFIIVKDGVYRDSAKLNSVVCIQWDWNTETNWRILKAEHLHGAEINGASMARTYGIYIHNSSYWFIEGFEIDSCSWVGIYFEKKDSNVYIYHNKIHSICKDIITDGTEDYGRSGIGTDETDKKITIDGNIIYDCGRLPNPDHEGPWSHNYKHDHGINSKGYDIVIKNNIFYDNAAGWNLKLDGNDFFNTGFSHIVVNNTFATLNWENPQRAGHIRFSKSSPCEYRSRAFIANNIFYDPPVSGTTVRHAIDATAEGYVAVIKNCLTNQDSIIHPRMTWYIPGIEVYNCYEEYNPYFVDVNNFNFHLTDSSPCVDSGCADSMPGYDMDMHIRPIADSVDIGAYEHLEGNADFPEEESEIEIYELNIPNIIYNELAINYSVPKREYVNISLYDILGREISILVDGVRNSGYYSVFKKVDIAPGTYFIAMNTETYKMSKKFIYLSKVSGNYNYLP
jgi:hypothetical protein